jgi:hypothetical protein
MDSRIAKLNERLLIGSPGGLEIRPDIRVPDPSGFRLD